METSYLYLLLLPLGVAIVDWFAVAQENKRLEFFAKPAVMVVLLIWLALSGGLGGGLLPFGVGLLFSLAGDVFLMLPQERFIAGLVSFLLAHLAYLVGFNQELPPLNLASLLLFLVVAFIAVLLYRRIAAGLEKSGNQSLKGPVLAYSIVIGLMLLSALLTLTKDGWQPLPAITASLGAALFFLSDTFLAWNKFVARLPFGRLRVIINYHLGQILIVLGAALHFLNWV